MYNEINYKSFIQMFNVEKNILFPNKVQLGNVYKFPPYQKKIRLICRITKYQNQVLISIFSIHEFLFFLDWDH